MTATDLLERLKALVLRDRAERELDEELRYHLEREAEVRARSGSVTPEREARIALGGMEQVKEDVREARGVRTLEELLADTRYALRALGRNLGFTVTVIAVLGIAIGAATAVYTVVHRVLLAELPFPEASRLVRIRQLYAHSAWGTISAVDFMAVRDQQRSFDAVGAIRFGTASVPGPSGPEVVRAGRATSGFFKALGMRVAYGRVIEPGDDDLGAPPMVVVSHQYAERSLGGAASAVGKAMTIDGVSYTVAGVLEPKQPSIGTPPAIWTSLRFPTPTRRGPFGFNGIARLKEGVTLAQATRDLDDISVRIFPLWAAGFQDSSARLAPEPLRDAVIGTAGRQVGLFAGAVALVLLLAIANVATLMLVRASAREHELAVRVALGAGRDRVARLILTECVVLTLLAGAAGVAIAAAALGLVGVVAPGLPRLPEVALDGRSFAFAIAVALLSGVLVSLAPLGAVFSRRSPVSAGLLSSPARGGASRRSNTLRGVLVVTEFALALPLLLGAGLLANSFLRLQQVDAGFDPRGVVGVGLSLPSVRYGDSTVSARFWRQAEARALAVEGITAAGFTSSLPPDNFGDVNNFDLIDRPVPAGSSQPTSPWPIVTTGYFAAMGVPLLEGRLFTAADTTGAPPVLVASRAWAAKYYPGTSAVGRQMHSGGCSDCPPETIVGVVGDVLYQGLAGDGIAVYAPVAQDQPRALSLVARTTASQATTIRDLRQAVASLDPELAPTDIVLTERLHDALGDPRRWAAVVGAFAAAGALLAALGIFGLMSYVVRQRRREIGVRMALGATPQDLVWFVLQRGMRYALVGTALGLIVSAMESRWLGALLYGVHASDPITMLLAVIALLAIALVACLLPGLRAARIRPLEAIGAD